MADIYVTELGTEGPRIVLVHGSAQGSSVGGNKHYLGQLALAEQGWQLAIPDRPGHGRSPAPGRPDDFELDGEWVAEMLGEGAHLVGHSYGGLVALAAAALRPGAVKSLTLVEGAMQSLTLDDPRTQDFVKRMVEAFSGASSPAEVATRFMQVAGIPNEITGRRDAAELDAMGKASLTIRLPTPERVRELIEAVAANQIPLLTVSGGWEPGIDASSERAAQVGGGHYVRIESPHHLPQNHDPVAFNAVFTEHMKKAEALA